MKRDDLPGRLAAVFTAAAGAWMLAWYLSNLGSGPFEDDFGWVAIAGQAVRRGFGSVWTSAFDCYFFRPLNTAILFLGIRWHSWPFVHGVALAAHLLFAVLVARLALRLAPGGGGRWLALGLGGAFFLHQGNPTAVLQLDTVSQALSDLFGALALVAGLAWAEGRARSILPAALACLLAMLGKEGGVAAPLGVLITVALFAPPERRRRMVGIALAVLALTGLVYFGWRHLAHPVPPGPEVARGRYMFGLGVGNLRNLGQFLGVEMVPWNSASLVLNRRPVEWLLGLASAGLVLSAAALGWRRLLRRDPRNGRVLAWLALVFGAWCLPYLFMPKVSEQYVYRLTAVTVLVLGLGCWELLAAGRRGLMALALAAWCAWVGIHAASSVAKCADLKHNARVVEETLEAMKQALGDLSGVRQVRVFLAPEPVPGRRYSVIRVPDAELRLGAPLGLALYLRRPDLEVESYLPRDRVPEPRPGSGATALRDIRVDVLTGRAERLPE